MDPTNFALPLYEQRLEKAFKLEPFLDYIEDVINESMSDSDNDSGSEFEEFKKSGLKRTKDETTEDLSQMYNFSCIKKKRQWLKDVLLSSSESEDERELDQNDLQEMLWEHRIRKKITPSFYQKEENKNYLYYGAGLLSHIDRYPEHQRYLAGSKRKKNKERKEKEKQGKFIKEEIDENRNENSLPSSQHDESSMQIVEDPSEEFGIHVKSRSKTNRREKKPKRLDAQALAIRRHKLWVLMAKKEVGRCQKSKASFRKEVLQNCKKMATGCMRFCRHKALQSQKTVKDKVWLLKRLTRTMQTEWKKFDRIMKEQNRRAEKEAEEQRKIDKEILEAKRQQRKVNFLITLPELYAHFMKNKMGSDSSEDNETNSILKQLEDDEPLSASITDDYDSEEMKAQALKTAQEAYTNQQSRVNAFSDAGISLSNSTHREHEQPSIFVGKLKSYQHKGMNWLANLYYFGINGILADEMGLGKTVQSLAFLAHICEEYDTWGPFLIVTPASTLHNWTGEITRFVPDFKVVPYWGNPEERKNLRKFFDGKNLGSKEASFHLVVTSYQIVIQDFKFLNRLKWNYMILDEAQALKSINSQRWKQLLGFSCRNRLLLSGTPIQNSMAELWALLHFIMPTLFDSHSWFNEWFSKDIEGYVENRTTVDEKHLNRLHMILKPFMLRRVKTEVENELSDKIEIMMYCPLTLRQRFLYEGLKNKISIDELMRTSMGNQSMQSVTTSLMNLVMQFRKVCNHPELMERREVTSPLTLYPECLLVPKMLYREGFINSSLPSRDHLLYNRFSIFHPSYIYSSLTNAITHSSRLHCFSFLKFIDLDICDIGSILTKGLIARFLLLLIDQKRSFLRHHRRVWSKNADSNARDLFLMDSPTSPPSVASSLTLRKLIFTSYHSSFYTHKSHHIHYVPESLNHRLMRLQKQKMRLKVEDLNEDVKLERSDICQITPSDINASTEEVLEDEDNKEWMLQPMKLFSPTKSPKTIDTFNSNIISFKKESLSSSCDPIDCDMNHVNRGPILRSFQPTSFPSFLLCYCSKAHSMERDLYSHDRSIAWSRLDHRLCSTPEGLSCILYGTPEIEEEWKSRNVRFRSSECAGLMALRPVTGWNHIIIPDKNSLIMDAGKLYVLDTLLSRLKAGDHRVLIYSQMTKMIDLLEEYMWHRKHKYMRLDGSSKISDRRDMVEDFQNKSDIFVFLLSTRAGGVGINLTAADTVIFYDSDWNPTVDQQAMDRAHRLGQTKQVTVYRLICKSTIEERILERAREKSEIQRMVISGGNFKPDTLKPKEVVSLLLDDDIEKQYRARQRDKRAVEYHKLEVNKEKMRERMRKRYAERKWEKEKEEKKRRLDDDPSVIIDVCGDDGPPSPINSGPPSPEQIRQPSPPAPPPPPVAAITAASSLAASMTAPAAPNSDEGSSDALHIVDVDLGGPSGAASPASSRSSVSEHVPQQQQQHQQAPRGQRKRGRPRGSGLRGRSSRNGLQEVNSMQSINGVVAPGSEGPSIFSPGACSDVPGSGSPVSVALKRGRGRPRLVPLGPGHHGSRPPPALPVALQGALASPSQESASTPTSGSPSSSASTSSSPHFKLYNN